MSTDTRPTVGSLGYEATCHLTTGATLEVTAYRGVEAVGRTSHKPLGVADFGVIYLKTNDGARATILTIGSTDDARLIIDTLSNALRTADSYTDSTTSPANLSDGLSDDSYDLTDLGRDNPEGK